MRTRIPFALLAIAFACTFATAPAHARARVFVASYGDDANPCTFGSPCKTFQHAHDAVDAGGEVTAIDSAGFGPINITKAVTITSPDGVEAGIVPTGAGDAIDINAGPNDVVVLRGLTLNGSGVGGNGIVFNSGGSLTVINCVVQNFEAEGISIQLGTSTTVYFAIINTLISNNRLYGIDYHAANFSKATGVIDHVAVAGGQNGIALNGGDLTNGSTTDVAISNSVASNNRFEGIFAGNGSVVTVSIDNTTVNGNGEGIHVAAPATVRLSRSVIQGNGTGTVNNTNPANTFYTYGNNLIASNGTDFGGTPLNTTDTLH
jgi:hypothetical protein